MPNPDGPKIALQIASCNRKTVANNIRCERLGNRVRQPDFASESGHFQPRNISDLYRSAKISGQLIRYSNHLIKPWITSISDSTASDVCVWASRPNYSHIFAAISTSVRDPKTPDIGQVFQSSVEADKIQKNVSNLVALRRSNKRRFRTVRRHTKFVNTIANS